MVVYKGMPAARIIRCKLQQPSTGPSGGEALSTGPSDQVKVVLQPRLCTLRSYASDRDGGGVIKVTVPKFNGQDELELSPFLANLFEYIESTKKSQDFEIVTGRLAMMIFAAMVGAELATGDSVFKKMDVQGIAEALGACLAAVTCAAAFAYSSSARKRVGRIFDVSCNAFIDALIDNIIDGLFYESDHDDDRSDKDLLDK